MQIIPHDVFKGQCALDALYLTLDANYLMFFSALLALIEQLQPFDLFLPMLL